MAAAKKVNELIKEARTAAGLSQQALAEQIDGLSASDISKAERGEKELTKEQLKAIAKATGVTQKSLLEAPAPKTAAKPAAAKPASSTAKPASTAAKTSTGTSMKVTTAEKKLVELYRKADADKKKEALRILQGKDADASEIINSLLGSAMDMFLNKK